MPARAWACTIALLCAIDGAVAARVADSAPPLVRSGTGFFVSDTGEMLTSAHVVRGCRRIEVWPRGAASGIAASIESSDARLDLALLATNHHAGRVARLDDGAARGQGAVTAIATIGYGFTASAPLDPVFTHGRAEGTTQRNGRALIVLRARLYEGNSGGPVVAEEGGAAGSVIGMVTGRLASDPERGVAVPASELSRFLRATRRPPEAARIEPGRDAAEKYLGEMSALVQCLSRDR